MLKLEDYERHIGGEAIERILNKAKPLRDQHIVNISSTYYGGGVAAKLSSLALMMNGLGIKTGWRIIQGNPDFFGITKNMHNALQGGEMELTDLKKQIYEQVNYENAIRNHLHHDIVVVHDPQPLPLIQYYTKTQPWLWRCHIDLTAPHRDLWHYLRGFIDQYDAAIISAPEYAQDVAPPQFVHMPATDPFSLNNREMDEDEVERHLDRYHIPTDLPIVLQVSRFDIWKDPLGVIEAYKIAREKVNCRLILLGSAATDDPEGAQVYESLLGQRDERILLVNVEDSLLVNALQRYSAVVLQKSLREGFGLTVTEAMWKGQPVIGGNVGGIRYQIQDGVNGFLVNSIQEAADRIVELLQRPDLRRSMGEKARETVRSKFLMTRLLEQYLDLFSSFEVVVRVRENPALIKAPPRRAVAAPAPAPAAAPRETIGGPAVGHVTQPPATAEVIGTDEDGEGE